MGIRIRVHDREPIGLALRRLKKQLQRLGITGEMRRRGYFADPSQARRRKQFNKRLKSRQATLLAQESGVQPVASLSEARAKFWARRGKP